MHRDWESLGHRDGSTPTIYAHDAAQRRQVSALLAARLDVRDGDHVAMAAVLGQTTAQLARWLVHDAPSDLDQALLLDEVAQLLVRYLEKKARRWPRAARPADR